MQKHTMMENEPPEKLSRLSMAAILSLIFLSNGTLLMSPALSSISAAFPAEAYDRVLLVYTLPSFVAIPFALLSGQIAGKYIRYKTMLMAAAVLYIISGLFPLMLNSLTGILICRALFGIAAGFIGPQGNALILRNFTGEMRYRNIGYASAMIGISGVIFQLVGGYLCSVGWKYTFLGYALGVIPLLLIATSLKEPPAAPQPLVQQTKAQQRLPFGVFRLCLILGLMYAASQMKILSISYIVTDEGIGDSRTSAMILSIATLGAIPGGLLFEKFCGVVSQKWRAPVLLFTLALSSLTTALCQSVFLLTFGFFFGVVAFIMALNLYILRASALVPPERTGRVTAMVQCFEKIGVFASTYFVSPRVSRAVHTIGRPAYRWVALVSLLVYVCIGLTSILRQNRRTEVSKHA